MENEVARNNRKKGGHILKVILIIILLIGFIFISLIMRDILIILNSLKDGFIDAVNNFIEEIGKIPIGVFYLGGN